MKVIIITGGSDGIGAEMARQLARRHGAGVALVLAARNQAMLEQVAAECAALIIAGMEGRKREVVMSAKGRLGRWMKLIAPGLVEKMALAALKDDVKPH